MNIQRLSGSNFAVSSYKKSQPVQGGKDVAKSDGVVLSGAGQVFNEALQKVKSFPEVREDKVSQLANSIKNGTYKLNTEDLAKKMIAGAM